MYIEVKVILEAGYGPAMLGLSLSYQRPVETMPAVALRLHDQDDGHNKFLESIKVWLDITMPRYWWQEFDTYRIATKQSESTMHTLMRQPLTQANFVVDIPDATLARVNELIAAQDWLQAKRELPESFLQRRIVCLDYKSLRNILLQRRQHRLPEWRFFQSCVMEMIQYPELLPELEADYA